MWGLLERLPGVTPHARQPMGKWNRSAAVISYIYNCLINKLNLANKKSEIITLPSKKACLLNIFSYPTNLALRIAMCSARWASSTGILWDLKRYEPSWRELLTESILGERRIQPYVHDCFVSIQDDCCTHHFWVFLKCHTQLHTNKYLPRENNFDMHGSSFVMHVAAMESLSMVNMRGGDAKLSDWMIGR